MRRSAMHVCRSWYVASSHHISRNTPLLSDSTLVGIYLNILFASYAQQVTRAEAKDIIFDNSSRRKMQDGINKIADAVGVTLGPRGE